MYKRIKFLVDNDDNIGILKKTTHLIAQEYDDECNRRIYFD